MGDNKSIFCTFATKWKHKPTFDALIIDPLSPKKRRGNMAHAEPVRIGNDVWIGGNVTIMPGITIGNLTI